MKKVYFKTFGCRTNLYDTQVMMANIGSWEVTADESLADVVVINSCTVTNSADSTTRSYINRIKRETPHKKVLFTGCGVQSQGVKLLDEKRIDGLFGHSQKEQIEALISQQKPFSEIGHTNHIDTTLIEKFEGKSRAFIKIQEGCDFDCSYCIIPSVRGFARSMPTRLILDQIKILLDQGYEEFILTGTNMGSYGVDKNETLAELIKEIAKLGVKRLRLGSLEPVQITDELIALTKEPFMAKHLHIALQHTSNQMLEMMNRKNRFESDLELFTKLADQGLALGTDYIVGFPNESEEIFDEAVANLRKLPLTHIHLFSYSPRDGTQAATMKQDVAGDQVTKRRAVIGEIIAQKHREFYEKLKTPLEVLVEKNNSGLDQYFSRVEISSDQSGFVTLKDWWYDGGKIRANF